MKKDLTDEAVVADYIKNPPVAWCGAKGFEGADKYRWNRSMPQDA